MSSYLSASLSMFNSLTLFNCPIIEINRPCSSMSEIVKSSRGYHPTIQQKSAESELPHFLEAFRAWIGLTSPEQVRGWSIIIIIFILIFIYHHHHNNHSNEDSSKKSIRRIFKILLILDNSFHRCT